MFNLGNIYDPVPTQYDQSPNITPNFFQSGQPQVNPGPAEAAIKGWDGWLAKLSTDSNLQQSLLQAGVQMMTPKGPNQNAASKLGEGLQVGFGTYNQLQNQDLAREQTKANTTRMKAGTVATEAQTVGQGIANELGQRTMEAKVQGTNDAAVITGVQADNAGTMAKLDIEGKTNANTVSGVQASFAERMADQNLRAGEADITGKEAYTDYTKAATEAQSALADYRKAGGSAGAAGTGKLSTSANDAAMLATIDAGDRASNTDAWNASFKKYYADLQKSKEASGKTMAFKYLEASGALSYPVGHPKRVAAEAAAEEFGRNWESNNRGQGVTATPVQAPATTINPSTLSPQDQALMEQAVNVYVQQGMSPEDARTKALEVFSRRQGSQP
jgi:hypothetical protein